jgi:hypothetical protein
VTVVLTSERSGGGVGPVVAVVRGAVEPAVAAPGEGGTGAAGVVGVVKCPAGSERAVRARSDRVEVTTSGASERLSERVGKSAVVDGAGTAWTADVVRPGCATECVPLAPAATSPRTRPIAASTSMAC